ncbi:MAG: hypothetical protein FWC36_03590, partial [Spirochaetes bacterium]|nr:hypothetical protein [Spirochaetota bacterium]
MKAILFVFALMLFFSCSHFLATMEPASAGNTANEELIIGGAVIRKFGPFQRIQDPRSSRSRWGHPHIGYYLQSEIESIKRIVLDVSPNRAPMFINCCHGRWLRSSLDGVEQLVNLQEVIISSSRIDDVDFSPLYNLQNLNSITLIGESLSLTAIPDFSGLASRESIQRLSIERAMSLDNLNNIKHLPNLQRIFIMSPGIGSLEGIGGLEKLESFETGNAWDSRLRIADMLPLPNLRRLILGDVRTVDITGIEQLVSLEELAFLCTFHGRLSHVKNIQYLSGLENLRSLRVAIAETD